MTRLLFVDDDPRVLSGLRRQLHGRRPDWSLHFAPGGDEALAEIDAMEWDVVISDMRMPGVDGTAVLAATAQRRPRAARLMLSGHADAAGGAPVGSGAHTFLDKPCETEALLSAVDDVLELRAHLDALADPVLENLWRYPSSAVVDLPELLETLLGQGRVAADVAHELLASFDERRVLAVAAAVRSDLLGLDASPREVVSALGASGVIAVVVAQRVHQVAGGDWTYRLAQGTALAVASHEVGRSRGLSGDELSDLLLASLLAPLDDGSRPWPLLLRLLKAWDLPSRALIAIGPSQTADGVGAALAAVRTSAPQASDDRDLRDALT